MALIDVAKSCLDSIRQISEDVQGAVLYVDAGCTESFQFMGAFPLLLELGVRAICSLENMNSLDAVVDWNSKFDHANKLVVMTSRLLSDAHRYILRCLSTHHGVGRCTIFTSISEIAHSAYPDSPLGPDAFREYESLLVQDYDELVKKGKIKSQHVEFSRLSPCEDDIPLEASTTERDFYEANPTNTISGIKLIVSVHHFPMIICPFSPRVFVLPSEGSVAEALLSGEHEDSLGSGLPPLSTGRTLDSDDAPPGATLTAHFLYHLAVKMDLKFEIFSLGDLSKNVGKNLTDMSSLYDVGRRKRSAGLLLVDRTLDLLTPCCHGDSLVDRIFSSLRRRERTIAYDNIRGSQLTLKQGPSTLHRARLDVEIPLGEILSEENCKIKRTQLAECIETFLSGWDSGKGASQVIDLLNLRNKAHQEKSLSVWNQLMNGSLVCTESFRGTPYIEAILDRKTKDGAMLVKKWLQEALRRENITVNVRTRPGYATKPELQTMIRALSKSQSSIIRNKGIIQLASAVVGALDESHSARWDTFNSAEKMLNVSAGDTSQSLAAQIGDLINKSALVEAQLRKDKKVGSTLQGLLSLQDAILLTAVGYMLAGENFPTSGSGGPFSWQEEHFLKEAIVDAILENPSVAKSKFLHGLTEELVARANLVNSDETSLDQLQIDDFDDDQWGKWGEEEEDESNNNNSKEQSYDELQLTLELRDRVDNLFKCFHKLSSMGQKNLPLKEGSLSLENSFSSDMSGSKGLLYRLLTRVLGKHDVPGLEYHSSTVGRIFKSGFGRFGLGQAKASLSDQSVILVFVLGGINGLEVLEAQEALSESGRPDIELILGGTTLLTPDDMLDLLLAHV